MPKVSVIVPVYNVEQYLEKCLNSLVGQTIADDIEIIVVNDGSTDGSHDIIKEFEEKHSNIIYLRKENGGLSDARNYGLKRATGDYIAFLDSDDFVDETLYEKLYNKAIEEEADYVECDFYWAYPKRKKDKYKLKLDKGIRYENKEEMISHGRVCAWNKLIKKDIITEEFPKGLKFEDIEFFYKLVPNINKVAFVEEPLIYYVQRSNSLINKQDYTTGQIFNVLNNSIDFYEKEGLFEEYKDELGYIYTKLLFCSSLKRIAKVKDRVARERLFYETWQNVNTRFPNWKKNPILKKEKGLKKVYLMHLNKYVFKLTCFILRFI
ncbi:MAG: glycosyltransferase [Clostridia bacterium]|nr:glycosyltransferase [Clostridia bacterium]